MEEEEIFFLILLIISCLREFPQSPVAKTLCSQCKGSGVQLDPTCCN